MSNYRYCIKDTNAVSENETDDAMSDSAPLFDLHVPGTRPATTRRHTFDLPVNPYANRHLPEVEVVPKDVAQQNSLYV